MNWRPICPARVLAGHSPLLVAGSIVTMPLMDDEPEIVAEPFAEWDQGKWFACVRYVRGGVEVASSRILRNKPSDTIHEASQLARRYIAKLKRGSGLPK
jgi:hypothetical protein